MVGVKNVAIVGLCSAFVLGFALVTFYATSGVALQNPDSTTGTSSASPCYVLGGPRGNISITSASLTVVSYTDELGLVGYSNLSISFKPVSDQLSKVTVCIGAVGVVSETGPFLAGQTVRLNLALPETVVIQPGSSYLVQVEGANGNGSASLGSLEVTATD